MIQGLIERAITRPTQRDDPGARESGREWAMQRVEDAMDFAEQPQQRHASREEQVRRRWMGNWVQTGDREGYREPGNLFGQQPPRLQQPDVDREQLRERVMDRYQQAAQQQDNPSRYGAGSYVRGGQGSVYQALAASHLPDSVRSMRSAMGARQSLGGDLLDPRTPDRGGQPQGGQSRPRGAPDLQGILGAIRNSNTLFGMGSSGGSLLSRTASSLARSLQNETGQSQGYTGRIPSGSGLFGGSTGLLGRAFRQFSDNQLR